MAANTITDFDLGPLTWVKTEIDHSLAQARENLDKLAAAPADRAPVKYILTHLHQATGALAMVGLAAATRFNEELEKLVAYLEGEDAARLPGAAAAAKRGIAALSGYLDTLLAGQVDHPMRLLAPYLELNRGRGANDANEGDLFFPNLAAELPGQAAPAPLDDAVLNKALALQRAQYQQGLLKMLKSADNSEALRQMQAAIAAIESMQAANANRAFWTAATGFFDAFVFGGLDVSPSAKPLFAKLDQQVKQLMDGGSKVAERLFRDLLLAVGRARPVSERITLLKETYRLEQLLAIPDGVHGADDEALAGAVRELRELTAQQKDTWLKYTSGNRAALEPFGKQSLVLADRAGKLPQRDILMVLTRLTDVAPGLKARAIPPSEAQSLEVATSLLFIESALENYFKLGADFSRQANTVTERLKSAMAGEALPPMDAIEGGLLDEMTRRAQEKLLVFQVGQEVQVNLQNIEQVLDGYFRDAARRPELAALPAQFAQVQGALMIMELMDAAALNAAVMARVQQFAEGSLDGAGESAEMVADGLSALGLYITALQQGAAAPRDVLMPALLRFGLVEAPIGRESQVRRTGTVSPLDIDVQKQKVAALYEDWKEAPADGTRERLERAVGDLHRDAAVVSDSAVARQSADALQLIQDATAPDQTGVFNAIQGLAPDKAPQDPTPQMVQLVDAPGAEVDKELLDIFLEEAAEVVDTIASSLAACRDAPHDRENLTTIRRGFHTLKGSGRMVGLMDLGEMAWQCEQVMNKWLKDEKPAEAELLDFIDLSRRSFDAWVTELKDTGSARVESAEILQRAEILKSDAPLHAVEPEAATAAPVAEAPQAPDFVFESLDLAPAPVAEAIAAEAPALDFATLEAKEPPLDFSTPAEPELIAAPEPAASEPEIPAATVETNLDFDSLLAAPAPAEAAPAEEASVVIGNVSVPSALFAIFIGEAEQHTTALDREMARIEADPMVPVSADFMRAAHTLASTSRTTGFETLADAALALEKWLADAMELPPEFDAHRLAATRNAIDAVTAMVQSIRGNAEPYPRDDVVATLETLRQDLRAARRTGEGTHIKMPGVVREALEALDAFNQSVAAAPAAEPIETPAPPVPVSVVEAIEPPAPVETAAVVVPPVAVEPPAPVEAAMPAAAPAAPFESGKDQRKIRDDVDRDLLPVFIDEAREIVPRVSEGVRRWKAAPTDHSFVAELQRHLHTLKGSARMTGLMRLGELAHVLETRINAIDEVEAPAAKEFDEIEERVDRFSTSLERLS
ncbi:MAG TPA: Hpt domain-containing protein, partial [Usitatibacter sp.]|nr:Hpt domain-containing protein [Usitatibacter sp.]